MRATRNLVHAGSCRFIPFHAAALVGNLRQVWASAGSFPCLCDLALQAAAAAGHDGAGIRAIGRFAAHSPTPRHE